MPFRRHLRKAPKPVCVLFPSGNKIFVSGYRPVGRILLWYAQAIFPPIAGAYSSFELKQLLGENHSEKYDVVRLMKQRFKIMGKALIDLSITIGADVENYSFQFCCWRILLKL